MGRGRGSWVVGSGSCGLWVVGRGSWVVGPGSWVVVCGSWVVVVGRRSSTRSLLVGRRDSESWAVVGRRRGRRSWVVGRRGSWVVGRGSWAMGRGSWARRSSVVDEVVGCRSWVVGRGSWVLRGPRPTTSSIDNRRPRVKGVNPSSLGCSTAPLWYLPALTKFHRPLLKFCKVHSS